MQSFSGVLVLKGPSTLIAQGSNIYVDKSGSASLATAGSGDVLAGVIASFMAQGMTPLDAAVFAVQVHARAGDIARARYGEHGLIASDLLKSIATALN